MSLRLFVDPGLHACGTAIFDGSRLVAAGLPEDYGACCDRSHVWTKTAWAVARWAVCLGAGRDPDELIVELPRVRDRRTQRAAKRGTDPNDLIELAAVVGALSMVFRDAVPRAVLPEEWKGTMPKEIMHARATGEDVAPARRGAPFGAGPVRAEGGPILTPAELAVLPRLPKSKLHNVLDAVCMGLVYCGRMRTAGSVLDGNPARARPADLFAPARRHPISSD